MLINLANTLQKMRCAVVGSNRAPSNSRPWVETMNRKIDVDDNDRDLSTRKQPVVVYKRPRSHQPPSPKSPTPMSAKRQRPKSTVEPNAASTGDDDDESDDELLVNATPVRSRERRFGTPQTSSARRQLPPVSAASAPIAAAPAPLLAPRDRLLPRYRARGNIDVAAISSHPAFFGRTDRIMDGSVTCARMEAFSKGGRVRRALAEHSTTGNLGETNVNELRRLLKQRYATARNDERFNGSQNTSLLIDHVLLPEMAIVLVMHACGGDITEEQAVEFLERPVISEAERRRVLAEARGGSRVSRW
jgi:hypothetical protein